MSSLGSHHEKPQCTPESIRLRECFGSNSLKSVKKPAVTGSEKTLLALKWEAKRPRGHVFGFSMVTKNQSSCSKTKTRKNSAARPINELLTSGSLESQETSLCQVSRPTQVTNSVYHALSFTKEWRSPGLRREKSESGRRGYFNQNLNTMARHCTLPCLLLSSVSPLHHLLLSPSHPEGKALGGGQLTRKQPSLGLGPVNQYLCGCPLFTQRRGPPDS